jgi:hypothetical protein
VALAQPTLSGACVDRPDGRPLGGATAARHGLAALRSLWQELENLPDAKRGASELDQTRSFTALAPWGD